MSGGAGCWVGGAGVAGGRCSPGARLEDADDRKDAYMHHMISLKITINFFGCKNRQCYVIFWLP